MPEKISKINGNPVGRLLLIKSGGYTIGVLDIWTNVQLNISISTLNNRRFFRFRFTYLRYEFQPMRAQWLSLGPFSDKNQMNIGCILFLLS